VLYHFSIGESDVKVSISIVAALFVLGVGANVLYCLVYIPELVVQYSEFYDLWKKYRLILFIIGLITAGILAYSTLVVAF